MEASSGFDNGFELLNLVRIKDIGSFSVLSHICKSGLEVKKFILLGNSGSNITCLSWSNHTSR